MDFLEIKYPAMGVQLITIKEKEDACKETGTEMMSFNIIFNEWYATQNSKKIGAVNKMKAEQGKRIRSIAPYGYVRYTEIKGKRHIDEAAAEVDSAWMPKFRPG